MFQSEDEPCSGVTLGANEGLVNELTCEIECLEGYEWNEDNECVVCEGACTHYDAAGGTCDDVPNLATFDEPIGCAWTCDSGTFEVDDACTACLSQSDCALGEILVGVCGTFSGPTCVPCSNKPGFSSWNATGGVCSWTCDSGFFISGDDNNGCERCTSCGAGSVEAAPCGVDTDTVCNICEKPDFALFVTNGTVCAWQCLPGFYLNGDTCTQCSICGSGEMEATACTPTNDVSCVECGPTVVNGAWIEGCEVECNNGSFYDRDTLSCVACSSGCAVDEREILGCGVDHDVLCIPCYALPHVEYTEGDGECSFVCADGMYARDDDFGCETCSVCEPGTFEQEACTVLQDTVCLACTVTTSNFIWTDACMFTCEVGYLLTPDETLCVLPCEENEYWTGVTGQCEVCPGCAVGFGRDGCANFNVGTCTQCEPVILAADLFLGCPLACVTGYTLDPDTQECYEDCPAGNFRDVDSGECVECSTCGVGGVPGGRMQWCF